MKFRNDIPNPLLADNTCANVIECDCGNMIYYSAYAFYGFVKTVICPQCNKAELVKSIVRKAISL